MSAGPLYVFVRLLSAAAVFLAVLLSAHHARADDVEAAASVRPEVVELGANFLYTVQVNVSGGGTPTALKPGKTAGFAIQGTTGASPTRMLMIVNGVQSVKNGLSQTWQLRADRTGTFSLGPGTVTIDGRDRALPTTKVTVVAAGSTPQAQGRRQGRPGSITIDPFGGAPFDPFKGIFDFDDEPVVPSGPPTDPKLALDAPRGTRAFLHASVDKTRAVVGEQVTLSVYLYEDPSERQVRPSDVHEATANDFVKRSLMTDDTRAVGVGAADVGGRTWMVKLVRKNALFPIKTGRLTIDPMTLKIEHGRAGGLRESEALSVDVTEPPADGRPPGYAIGDVGDMSLQATVTPRQLARGDAVGVTVELRGTGNLPSQLTLPVVRGVEWLEPQTREKLGPMQGDRFGGTRTFSYVVRVTAEGEVDLGEIRLPYYDAARRAYATARASLGIVLVAPGAASDAGDDEPERPLNAMPPARAKLEGPRAEDLLADTPIFWAGIFGAPFGCVLAVGAGRALRRARDRKRDRAPSPERAARDRRAEADDACAGDSAAAAMSAIARAVEAAVLAETGVNLRGAAGETGRRELEDAGVDASSAREIVALLRETEDARFSPDGVSMESAKTTWTRAKKTLDAVASGRSGS